MFYKVELEKRDVEFRDSILVRYYFFLAPRYIPHLGRESVRSLLSAFFRDNACGVA